MPFIKAKIVLFLTQKKYKEFYNVFSWFLPDSHLSSLSDLGFKQFYSILILNLAEMINTELCRSTFNEFEVINISRKRLQISRKECDFGVKH